MYGDELSSGSARIVFTVLGLIFIFLGVHDAIDSFHVINRDSVASGFVVRLNAGGSHPQIQFRTRMGQIVSYPQGGFVFDYRKGDKVKVLYNPGDPSGNPVVKAFWILWGDVLQYISIGALILVYAVIGFKRFPVRLYWRGR